MYPRGPYDRRIELREPSSFHPFLKSFLLVAAIGALGGGGYFFARSNLIDPSMYTFGTGADRHVAAAATSYAASHHQNPDTEMRAHTASQQPPQTPANADQSAQYTHRMSSLHPHRNIDANLAALKEPAAKCKLVAGVMI